MKLLVSACLLGQACRYDGAAKKSGPVQALAERCDVCAVCPEVAGGLGVPRPPAEIQPDGRVVSCEGRDVSAAYEAGSALCVEQWRACRAPLAVLKAKSPACGSSVVYDGTYTGHLVPGEGVFARRLKAEGVCIVDEELVEDCTPSVEHPVAIVLGTGLGHLAQLVKPVRRIDYYDMPGFPEAARPVPGHRFEATIGTVDEVPVIVYPGRIHLYQGFSPAEVVSLVRHAHRLGCKDIIFACATGAVEGNAHEGLGIISDQINLTGQSPLADPAALRDLDTPFVGMTDAYSPYLRTVARGVADDLGITVEEGIYAGLLGPNFETPAETGLLRAMGVSYAGMSLVCEVIMAHALGMHVLGLTLATNKAGDPDVDHTSVLAKATQHADDFEALVRGVLRMLLLAAYASKPKAKLVIETAPRFCTSLKTSGVSPCVAPKIVTSGKKWSGIGTAQLACGSVL